ncbi:D-aminoacylase [bacterium]|nr:D-aminoacylase [bacterium]
MRGILALLIWGQGAFAAAPVYDWVLRGAEVIDGSGSPRRKADVAILADRIAATGAIPAGSGRQEIAASGLILAPGFIDMLGQSDFSLLLDPRAASKVYMGVTTEVTGEGGTAAPLSEAQAKQLQEAFAPKGLEINWRSFGQYLKRMEDSRPAINFASYVGASQLREIAVGWENRAATPEQQAQMEKMAAEALSEGAWGVSSALQYTPARFASPEELIGLARVAERAGGIYATHQRSEGDAQEASLDEVFAVAEKAKVPVEIFHLKSAYARNWGKLPRWIRKIEKAQKRGLKVFANIYPYSAAATGLTACLPPWLLEGGIGKTIERLSDPAQRARAAEEIGLRSKTWENFYAGSGGADGVLISAVQNEALKPLVGKRLAAIAKERGRPAVEVLLDLIVEDRGRTSAIYFVMSEDDVRAAIKTPWITFGTDSSGRATDGPLAEDRGHPRAWGTFARILGKYVREEKLITLEQAIRRMTSLPAERVGLVSRGLVRPGYFADLAVFDAKEILDRATYENPQQYAVGMHYVFVNGQPVLSKGELVAARPGQVLRREKLPKVRPRK